MRQTHPFRHLSSRSLALFLLIAAVPGALPAGASDAETPMLAGKASPKEILAVSPEWQAAYDQYDPDATAVNRIRSSAERAKGELRVDVVFGSWCGDSRDGVPRYLKIQDRLGGTKLKTRYIAVDRSKVDPKGWVEGKDIQRVPTFLVYWRGIEMGRIIETPKVSIEVDLAEILERPGTP